eukprot:tig00020553_g10648.t1
MGDVPPAGMDANSVYLQALAAAQQLAAKIRSQAEGDKKRRSGWDEAPSPVPEQTKFSRSDQNDLSSERSKQDQLNQLAAVRFSSAAGLASATSNVIGGREGELAFKEVMSMNGYITVMTNVPHSVVGNIIGRGGENIKSLQDQTGAHIQVTPESQVGPGATERPITQAAGLAAALIPCVARDTESDPDSKERIVTVSGHPEAVSEAEKLIHEIITQHQQRRMGGGGGGGGGGSHYGPPPGMGQVVHMKVPADRVGVVIGKGGATIRELQQMSNCRIQMSKESEPDPALRTVIIEGAPDAIAYAQELIKAKCERRPPGQSTGYGAPAAANPYAAYGYGAGGYGGYGYDASAYYQQGYYQQQSADGTQASAGSADGQGSGGSATAAASTADGSHAAGQTSAQGDAQADPAAYAAWYAQYQAWYASQAASAGGQTAAPGGQAASTDASGTAS